MAESGNNVTAAAAVKTATGTLPVPAAQSMQTKGKEVQAALAQASSSLVDLHLLTAGQTFHHELAQQARTPPLGSGKPRRSAKTQPEAVPPPLPITGKETNVHAGSEATAIQTPPGLPEAVSPRTVLPEAILAPGPEAGPSPGLEAGPEPDTGPAHGPVPAIKNEGQLAGVPRMPVAGMASAAAGIPPHASLPVTNMPADDSLSPDKSTATSPPAGKMKAAAVVETSKMPSHAEARLPGMPPAPDASASALVSPGLFTAPPTQAPHGLLDGLTTPMQSAALPHASTVPSLLDPGGNRLADAAATNKVRPDPALLLGTSTNSLEVGLAAGTHGWLRIRAELTDAGTVNAQLTASTPAAALHFEKELPTLSAYLQKEQVAVGVLSVQATVAAAGTPDAATATFSGASPQQDTLSQQPGAFSGQRQPDEQAHGSAQGETRPFSLLHDKIWSPAHAAFLLGNEHRPGLGLGGWLSVRV